MLNKLINFINESPTSFNAINNIKLELIEKGFLELKENESFLVEKGKNYFVIRNDSSLITFKVGKNLLENYRFKIVASHVDSPCFKVKPIAENNTNGYIRLNIEPYGGTINSTWLDKPLSLAGRIIYKNDNQISSKIINFNRPLLLIPNVCIHFNRDINHGYIYNSAIDLVPLFGQDDNQNILSLVSNETKIKENDILNYDLFVYNFEKGFLWGKDDCFISSPRLDDLESVFISKESFINSEDDFNINVCVFFDNEEVGSSSMQGAGSDFLNNVLRRIHLSLNKKEESYYIALSKSLVISCDNAHAVHPNHPEKTDTQNKVFMNQGIVIKSNAELKYSTDAYSSSVFQQICNEINVPYQFFANKSDIKGGSTLGNISISQVSIRSLDIGLSQLAMHSSLETAGSKDVDYLYQALKHFYQKD